MEAFVAVGAGFLLGVLWFDLMFDVQVRHAPVEPAAVHSIATYYRRVTTDARPMNNVVALAMAATVAAIVAELVSSEIDAWVGWVSLVLAVAPMGLAATRTVPRAKRLGAASDPGDVQAAMARRILAEHVACLVAIVILITVQLVSAASR